MFSYAEIDGKQGPRIAEVLERWQTEIRVVIEGNAKHLDNVPESRLELTKIQAPLVSVSQLFITTIPAVASQRLGWEEKLRMLCDELHEAELLSGYGGGIRN